MIWNMRKKRGKKVSLTWYFNELVAINNNARYTAAFRTHSSSYDGIVIEPLNHRVSYIKINRDQIVYTKKNGWVNEVYRTIAFSELPTGDLLTFLQANATPL